MCQKIVYINNVDTGALGDFYVRMDGWKMCAAEIPETEQW